MALCICILPILCFTLPGRRNIRVLILFALPKNRSCRHEKRRKTQRERPQHYFSIRIGPSILPGTTPDTPHGVSSGKIYGVINSSRGLKLPDFYIGRQRRLTWGFYGRRKKPGVGSAIVYLAAVEFERRAQLGQNIAYIKFNRGLSNGPYIFDSLLACTR